MEDPKEVLGYKTPFEVYFARRSNSLNRTSTPGMEKELLKRGCQHPSNKFEIFWQVAQNSFSLLLSYFVAQYVLIIVV